MGLKFCGRAVWGWSGPQISILKAPSSFLCVPNADPGKEQMVRLTTFCSCITLPQGQTFPGSGAQ